MGGQGDLGVALAVLRLVRRWNQEELARHSGVRSSSISDYERGKIVPGVDTLRKLLGAMDYPLAALDQAMALIATLKAESVLRAAARLEGGGAGASRSEEPLPAAHRWAIEQAAIEAGRVVTRLIRLHFATAGLSPGRSVAGVRVEDYP